MDRPLAQAWQRGNCRGVRMLQIVKAFRRVLYGTVRKKRQTRESHLQRISRVRLFFRTVLVHVETPPRSTHSFLPV